MSKKTTAGGSGGSVSSARLRDFIVWRRVAADAAPKRPTSARNKKSRCAAPASNDRAARGVVGGDEKAKGQFFTQPKLARRYVRVVAKYLDFAEVQVVEPSAGEGAFLKILPAGTFGCDIETMCDGVFIADFLTLRIDSNRPIAYIGNPPFGRNAKLAKRFFNHAARHCDFIAFILPRTFRKTGTINGLNDRFHLVHDEDVPADAFLFKGKAHTVPTVFQIWVRRDERRAQLPDIRTHSDFKFTTWDDADFALQRVGKDAGLVHHEMHRSHRAHYFIKGDVEDVMRKCRSAFAAVARNTAGNPSLSMGEIVAIYERQASRGRTRRLRG